MLKPIINPKLSLRARSLFYYYVAKGRVISANELWETKEVPEGRDAIRSAMAELKDFRYIKSVRVQVNGQWRTNLKFTKEALNMLSTDDGKSGVLYIDNYIASRDTTSTNNILKDTNVSFNMGAQAPLKKENEMGWNLDGEEEKPLSKSQTRRLAVMRGEDTTGSVGKVEDRQARLNAKYKKTAAEHAGRNREDTPEELWSTNDLVAEFYSLCEKTAPGVPAQVNGKYLSTWINKQVGEGTARIDILKAMRMFFADPRLTRDAGIGKSLWQRFFAYYPTVHGVVTKKETEYGNTGFTQNQEKLLRLLGGE